MTDEHYRQLTFYREEVKHEFTLLAMRAGILVGCQSFLVVPFAILNTAPSFRAVAVPATAVAGLGIYTAWVIREPIRTSHRILANWLKKQRAMLNESKDDAYRSERDKASLDKDHDRSIAFTLKASTSFIVFWIVALIWIAVRAQDNF